MHLGEEIFSCIFQLSTSLLILSKHRGEDVPRGGGGGGDSYMEQTGMLVGNFEFNP